MFDNWPVEAFLHDKKTINYFFNEVDKPDGHCALAQMIEKGAPVLPGNSLAGDVKEMALEHIEKRPNPLTEKEIKDYCYEITDLVDDIREPLNDHELIATGAKLYDVLANFHFRSNNNWSAERKQIPRFLKKYDSIFADNFLNSFDLLFLSKNQTEVITLAEAMLEPFGGLYFDGHNSNAPENWKLNELPSIELETERLKLKLFDKSDAKSIYELLKDGNVSKTTLNIPSSYKLEDADSWIDSHHRQIQLENQYTFAITDKSNNSLIGCVSIILNKRHNKGELGYWIGEKYWNKGFCREAAKKLLEFSFNTLNLNKVTSRYSLINPASGKVMEKIGMIKEGVLTQEVKTNDGVFHDLGVYGITSKQFKEVSL